MNVKLTVNSCKTKLEGALEWKYRPFRNLRLTKDEKDEQTLEVKAKAGILKDLDTDLLKFDINHPVDLLPLWSYDNSTNLIVTQDNAYPKIFNSRFSPTSKNRYLIVDRKGVNDTNIYDEDFFEEDSALYKNTKDISLVEYLGTIDSGNLKVGNYHFYFRYSDDDGNQSDFFAETGVVSIFRGDSPLSICTGFADQNAYKGVQLKLTKLDPGYSYIEVYYTRSAADINQNPTVTAFKIDLKFSSNQESRVITITGFENTVGISLTDINPVYQVFEGVSTLATAQNMLFFGNVVTLNIKYERLQNISYNIGITYDTEAYTISDKIKSDYRTKGSSKMKNSYYDSKFIYDKTGYWPGEIYRFGIVYVFKNNVLSPVFNIRGKDLSEIEPEDPKYTKSIFDADSGSSDLKFDSDSYLINDTVCYENVKGVVKLPESGTDSIFKIKFVSCSTDDTTKYLKELGVIGYFFVRQKRIPTTLCQAFTIGVDQESRVPAIPFKEKTDNSEITQFAIEGFLQKDDTTDKEYKTKHNIGAIIGGVALGGLAGGIIADKKTKKKVLAKNLKTNVQYLTHDYVHHTHYISNVDVNVGAICPEYDVNSPYLNSLFTGAEYPISVIDSIDLSREKWNKRSYYSQKLPLTHIPDFKDTKIIGVEDGVKLLAIGDTYFSARAGEAEEAFRYEYIGYENKITTATNLVRGIFGPYIGTNLGNEDTSKLIEIKIPKYSLDNLGDYFSIRMHDSSSYYALDNRQSIESLLKDNIVYRGDCYICLFTHRVNRNFNDPVAPMNDKILDVKCWKENYTVKDGVVDKSKFDKINLGDVNAVKMGQWVTFICRSNFNLNIRSIDESWVTEKQQFGQPRAFFPYQEMLVSGSAKIPEALCYNKGFLKSVSERYNYEVPDVPAIKNDFTNRISYSNINVTDSFKNGFRTFEGGHYKDYPKTYGSITKLIETNENLLCVFEHGIALIAVNERAVAAEGAGGYAYINTLKVLPDNPLVISDIYGSQWKDSIIKTSSGSIYGVDTVAKKIWQVSRNGFSIISDLKVGQFLNENISLKEMEVNPILGIRNVKTHCNAFKDDVIFTFYDNLESGDEKVWSLCYNEQLGKFVTFYSWLPSFSESIDNLYFSFNWETSYYLAKLAQSTSGNSFSNVITVEDAVVSPYEHIKFSNRKLRLSLESTLNLENFEILPDDKGHYKYFAIDNDKYLCLSQGISIYEYIFFNTSLELDDYRPVIQLIIGAQEVIEENGLKIHGKNHKVILTLTVDERYNKLTTNFWKHGQAGLQDNQGKIKPTNWYGKQHPFEFEFVVNENESYHKIFDNLQIISNSAEPESFHYEIVGDSYSFANDKKNMYIRQEATKHLFRKNGIEITYDDDYVNLNELLRNIKGEISEMNDGELGDKSTLFPLYYKRIDSPNLIEDYYHLKDGIESSKDFSAMAGAEITREKNLDEYRIWNHAKAVPITDQSKGRLRGNMHYKEDKWYVQINPINLVQANESKWENEKIPIVLSKEGIPEGFPEKFNIADDDRSIEPWDYNDCDNLEVKPKDKWMKVRIRYDGTKLAVINAVVTLYSVTTS